MHVCFVKAWGSILTESIVPHKQAVKLIVFPWGKYVQMNSATKMWKK